MKWSLKLAGLALGACSAVAGAATPPQISLKDPEVFREQLREMGYAPEPFEKSEVPSLVIDTQSGKLSVTLGGCEQRKNCAYIVLVSSFTDIKRPAADWVAARNVEYDLIKVWVSDEGFLTYSAGFYAEGMDRGQFRRWIDSTETSGRDLAEQAIKAGMDKP